MTHTNTTLPNPQFNIGDTVRLSQEQEETSTIRAIIWNFKKKQYYYCLQANGQSIPGRYSAYDLQQSSDNICA